MRLYNTTLWTGSLTAQNQDNTSHLWLNAAKNNELKRKLLFFKVVLGNTKDSGLAMRKLGPTSSTLHVTEESLGDPDLGSWVNHLHWSNWIGSEDHVFFRVSVDHVVTRISVALVELLPWWCWTPSSVDVPPWTGCFWLMYLHLHGWDGLQWAALTSCHWCVEGHRLGPTGTSLAPLFPVLSYSAFLNEGVSILVCPFLLFPLSHLHFLLPLLIPTPSPKPWECRMERMR